MNHRIPRAFLALLLSLSVCASSRAQSALGLFTEHTDIGTVASPGSASFDPGAKVYTVTGGGSNMWFASDNFQFVWAKASGDLALSADITFLGAGKNAHRKGCLMIRQSLDADSVYIDAALHGDGLTSLQYRDTKGGLTREVQVNVVKPAHLRLEKRGKYFSLVAGKPGDPSRGIAGSPRIEFTEPYYIGLGVCSHEADVSETAKFSNVAIEKNLPAVSRTKHISTLETVVLASKDRRSVFWTTNLIESPNWTRDTNLIFNSQGRLYRIPAAGGEPKVIDTGFANRLNQDHGVSPDGTQLVISDQSQERRSIIYTLPITGGAPKRITQLGPSYWHGWSPDGKTLAYCGERQGEYDIYTIPATGGTESRLTTSIGLDDGAEFSPDGQWIYFNSDRSGRMQIWRMHADGSQQEQLTTDEFNNWFPHPSPDGKSLVLLSYDKEVKGHPQYQDVTLRILNLATSKVDVLAKLFGGQGTINAPSWSPDSRRLAFVSYQMIP